jgi:hypothetical protein
MEMLGRVEEAARAAQWDRAAASTIVVSKMLIF